MRREVALEDISDGRLYHSGDMVKADCQDCQGCHDCCTGMEDTVILDPYDLFRLCSGLGRQPSDFMGKELILDEADGNILPHLHMDSASGNCVFLTEQGRCSIHAIRPGICRLFPLGRYYENDSFQYFLQIYECKKQNRGKIKVKKWLDTPRLPLYEKYIADWHYFLLDVQEILYNSQDAGLIKNLNLYVVSRFFLQPYREEEDFYPQFYKRLEEAKALLAQA